MEKGRREREEEERGEKRESDKYRWRCVDVERGGEGEKEDQGGDVSSSSDEKEDRVDVEKNDRLQLLSNIRKAVDERSWTWTTETSENTVAMCEAQE